VKKVVFEKLEKRLVLSGTLEAITPLHLGSGKPEIEIGEVEMPILRDPRGQPYIPGSSLKGKTRAEAEKIARQDGMDVCSPPNVNNMCGTIKRRMEDFCVCCRIFGTTGMISQASKVKFRDTYPVKEIEELLEEQREIYVGLMVFAGIPHLVAPLTDDYNTLRHLLYELTPDILPVQGSQLNLALQDAARWLQSQPTHDIPHALLISDGEFEADDLQASLELLAKGEFFLHVLGVGSQQGDFIPIEGDTWQKNAAGDVVISRLNEANLRQLAQAGEGIYRYASYRNDDSQAILGQIEASINTDDADKAVQKLWHERFYLLLIVMVILILPWFRRQRGQ